MDTLTNTTLWLTNPNSYHQILYYVMPCGKFLNTFPAIHDNCLLPHQLVFLGSLYCIQYGPRGSSLIKSILKCTQVFEAEAKSRGHFQDIK